MDSLIATAQLGQQEMTERLGLNVTDLLCFAGRLVRADVGAGAGLHRGTPRAGQGEEAGRRAGQGVGAGGKPDLVGRARYTNGSGDRFIVPAAVRRHR